MTNLLTFTVIGIVTGSIYAVAASGLVVTYTTSGIFNFAHGAVGMFLTFLYWELHIHHHWPTIVALVVVLFVCAPLMGVITERVLIRNLHGKETRVSLVVTAAMLLALYGTAQAIWDPGHARVLPRFFEGHRIRIVHVSITYHDLVVIAVAALTAVALRFLLFHTRLGVTMRAVVDDPELSSLNGAHPERVAQIAWAMGFVLAGTAGILIAPGLLIISHLQLTLLVVNGYAAAILGKLKSLPLTFLGAMILGLAEAYTIGYGTGFFHSLRFLGGMKPILPTIFLFAILLFFPQVRLRAGRLVGTQVPRVPGLRQSLVGAAVLVAVASVFATQLSEFWVFNISLAFVFGMVMLSLVLLSGYAGQVSLMQMVFVGVGCLAMGHLGGGSLLGVVLAAMLAAALGAVVGLVALRLEDLYLALTTLAFAVVGEWAFNQRWALDTGGILKIPRLHVLGLAFRSEQSQMVLTAVAFALIATLVLAIRRGRYGRLLAAMRDSPTACTTLGLNLVLSKTAVFAVSGAIAGVAGALFGGVRTSVTPNDFLYLFSLVIFLIASFGGLTTVTGALFGGAFYVLIPELQKHIPIHNIHNIGIGLGAIALADNPNGFGGNMSLLGELLRDRFRRDRSGDEVPASEAQPVAAEVAVL
jgi:branched-chain amino acid transport system permease protein